MENNSCVTALPCVNINSKELENALERLELICNTFEKINPGAISEVDFNIDILQEFSKSADVFYSSQDKNGKYISNFIFKTFIRLAYALAKGKIDKDDFSDIYLNHISVLKHFIDQCKTISDLDDTNLSNCC